MLAGLDVLPVTTEAKAQEVSKDETATKGDPEKGARVFKKCKACHTLKKDGGHTIGPNLHGFLMRPPASLEGFKYSQALKQHATDGLKWNDETLDAYLKKPYTYIKGTTMSFAGLRKNADRANVIAYLEQETGN